MCVRVRVCVLGGMVAGSVVLNVAQQPLLQILQRSSLSVSPPGAPRTTGETALYMPIATTAVRSKIMFSQCHACVPLSWKVSW